jgi:hypothetical protein
VAWPSQELELECTEILIAAPAPSGHRQPRSVSQGGGGTRGEIVTDAYQQTANPRIWMARNITGGCRTSTLPAAQGSAAANALFMPNGPWITPPRLSLS